MRDVRIRENSWDVTIGEMSDNMSIKVGWGRDTPTSQHRNIPNITTFLQHPVFPPSLVPFCMIRKRYQKMRRHQEHQEPDFSQDYLCPLVKTHKYTSEVSSVSKKFTSSVWRGKEDLQFVLPIQLLLLIQSHRHTFTWTLSEGVEHFLSPKDALLIHAMNEMTVFSFPCLFGSI